MDLKEEILKEHSKRQVIKIGKWIGTNKSRFKELVELCLHDEYVVTQRSVWAISYCADLHPELIIPWLPKLLKKMNEPGVHDAVKRDVLRVLAFHPIPKSVRGALLTICFEELSLPQSPIAVKVHSMTILTKIAKDVPDIIGELRATIEQTLVHAVPAIQVSARRALKELDKLSAGKRDSSPSRSSRSQLK